MNALEFLKQDHLQVSALFGEARDGNAEQQTHLFELIAQALETHTYLEETIFYPALQQHEKLQDLVAEAFEEHAEVKRLLEETRADSGDYQTLKADLQKLQMKVEHHVKEEENDMFPNVKQHFDAEQLTHLGQQMMAAKQQCRPQSSAAASGMLR